jgi:hypothetical protein
MGRLALLSCASCFLYVALSIPAYSQSITAGDVIGTVTDPSGSAVPNASVTLTNVNTNTVQKETTNMEGGYRFAFVPPGTYKVSVTANGFQAQDRTGINVSAGQPSNVDVKLAVASASTEVTVVEGASVVQTDNADSTTTFSAQSIADMPNPGSDITYIAQTAPGVVMNTQSGYGNFVAEGMPAISNLFTINGQNYNDPMYGINNSGASNLSLGANDLAEASVITSPYSAQYGQYAGSQIAYITKSGTNQWHGDAIYMWNGRYLNADQFFSNQVGEPRPFNNFNQWATNLNGPVWKNHTFFDVDYEGLRNLLPGASSLNLVPSPQFQAATLTNLAAVGNGDEIPFYKQLFAIYNAASGGAIPVAGGGCQGLTFAGLAANAPCAYQFRTTPPNINREFQWSARVDHTFNDKDRGYIRIWRDNGFQPTYTSPFGPTFNVQSNQPQMTGQVSEIHTFGPNTVNQFGGSTLFYAAVFIPSDPSGALAALPTYIALAGNPFSPVGAFGGPQGFFSPNGRHVFQYQVTDDFSHVRGKHTFRVGISWLHDDISDLDFTSIGGPIHGYVQTNLTDFFNGGGPGTSLTQAFPSSVEQGLQFNTLGGYVADDWKVTDRLTVSLNLRFEHYANPTCDSNCFSRLTTQFTGAPQPNAPSVPYNQMIVSGQHTAYPNTTTAVTEPRIGIAYRPFHNDKTVIRTGAGIFADELPGGLAENAAFNSPLFNAFTLGGPTSPGTIAPGAAGSLFTTAAAANQALISQFASGGSFNSISNSVPGFVAPSFYSFPNDFKQPTYYKWNFEVQEALPWKMLLSLNYNGMHGSHIPVADFGLNAFCPPSQCPNGFVGLPAAPANAALGTVFQYLSAGSSSYNGLTASLQRRIASGLTFNFNYTWSHALDDVSNGGIANLQFGAPGLITNPSISAIQNPFNVRGNYGDSDYDVRHYISASIVYTDALRHSGFRWGPNRVFGGWTLSSNIFFRTGMPFTPIDSGDYYALVGDNYDGGNQGAIFASPLKPLSASCGNAVNTPCLTTSEFAPSGALTGFGTIGRNTLRGPHFVDVDFAVMKDVAIAEHVVFSFGAHAYNLFNHPNFDQPQSDINNPNFGFSTAAVGPPTSILGSFVGAGSSPRFVELKGLVRFLMDPALGRI